MSVTLMLECHYITSILDIINSYDDCSPGKRHGMSYLRWIACTVTTVPFSIFFLIYSKPSHAEEIMHDCLCRALRALSPESVSPLKSKYITSPFLTRILDMLNDTLEHPALNKHRPYVVTAINLVKAHKRELLAYEASKNESHVSAVVTQPQPRSS